MTEMDMKRLSIWETKILGRMHGPVVEQGIWRIRTDREIRELHKDLHIVADSKKKRSE